MAFPQVVTEVSFTDPFSTPVWEDISAYVRGFDSQRGRQYELDRFEAGTLGVLLDNADSRFSPDNTQSPYWPDVVPMRRVRVGAGWEPLVLSLQPVAWWRLGETSGTTAVDASGNGHDGTYEGSPTLGVDGLVVGDPDTAVDMEGDNASGVQVEDAAAGVFKFGDRAPFSAFARIRPKGEGGSPSARVFDRLASGGGWRVFYNTSASNRERIFFDRHDGTGQDRAIMDPAPPLGTKMTVCVVYDGDDMILYVDGVEVDRTPSTRLITNDDNLGIGTHRDVGASFNGPVDEPFVCDYALSDDQIAALHQAATSGVGAGGYLADGYVEDWAQSWPGQGSDSIVRLTASDAFQILALDNLGGSYKAEVLADEPVAYWPLNETAGTTADDETDNALDGTYEGSPTLGEDNFSHGGGRTSVLFDGTDDYVDLGNQAALKLDQFTVEAWFKSTAGAGGTVDFYYILYASETSGVALGLTQGFGGAFHAGIDTTGTATDPEIGIRPIAQHEVTTEFGDEFNDGEWHHVAFTYDGSRIILYLDGAAVDNMAVSGSVDYGDGFRIGDKPDTASQHWDGHVSDLAVYDKALSPGRIAAHAANRFDQAPTERSDLRIGKILDTIGWPTADRDLQEGQTDVLAITADSQNVLGALQDVNTSEAGQLFIGTDGKVVFHDRHHRVLVLNESQVTFGDADSEDPNRYRELEPNTDVERLANIVEITLDGAVQVFEDEDSKTKYGPRRLPLDLQVSSTEAEARGHYELHRRADASTRLERLLIRPQYDPGLWAQALGREIGDRVTTIRRLPGGDTWTQTGVIEHVEHRSTASPLLWETVWTLSPAEEEEQWVLGDADLSLLGETTVVGY